MNFPSLHGEGDGRCLAAGLGLVSAAGDSFTDWIPDRVRNDVVGLGLDSSALSVCRAACSQLKTLRGSIWHFSLKLFDLKRLKHFYNA